MRALEPRDGGEIKQTKPPYPSNPPPLPRGEREKTANALSPQKLYFSFVICCRQQNHDWLHLRLAGDARSKHLAQCPLVPGARGDRVQAIRVISFSAAERHAHGHAELDIHLGVSIGDILGKTTRPAASRGDAAGRFSKGIRGIVGDSTVHGFAIIRIITILSPTPRENNPGRVVAHA